MAATEAPTNATNGRFLSIGQLCELSRKPYLSVVAAIKRLGAQPDLQLDNIDYFSIGTVQTILAEVDRDDLKPTATRPRSRHV